MKSDVVVIGAGPGGYAAAFRLGQLGKEVTLIEKEKPGGTCLQVGCIPSKALIAVAKKYEDLKNLAPMGIQIDGDISLDLATTQKWKNKILEQLTKGILHLSKKNNVNYIAGEAHFTGPNQLKVKISGKEETLDFNQCIIATGSVPIEIPGFPFDGKKVISSSEALALEKIPKNLAVIGGGYIGLELGSVYAKFGSKVSIIEMTPGLLPGFDREAVSVIERKLKRSGVEIYLDTIAEGFEDKGKSLALKLKRNGETIHLDCDVILVTVGRKPNAHGFGLENTGVKLNEKGFIPVNESLQSNQPHIYAIGDVVDPPSGHPMLAHKATREAEVVAEHIAGKETVYDSNAMPAVVFTDPEMATVGLQEEDAKKEGYDLMIGKFPFAASGKALISGHAEGFVKVIADKKSKALLGVQIVGNEAGTMISEAAVLIEMGATIDDLALTIHPHPTAPEAIMEAAKVALGEAIHIVNA